MRKMVALAACAVLAGSAGCSEQVLDPDESELVGPTTVSAQRYLADNAAAAESLRAFVDELDAAGPRVSDVDARRLAPELSRLAEEFTARAGRIERERLEDQRLEEQRVRLNAALIPAIAGVQAAAIAAEDGDAAALAAAADDLREALPELTRVGNT